MVICRNSAAGRGMRPSVIFASPESQNRFKSTILLSKDFLANILEPFGHLLLPDVFPGKNVKIRSIFAKIQVIRLSTELKSSGIEATIDFDFLAP